MKQIESYITDRLNATKELLLESLLEVQNSYPNSELLEEFLYPAKKNLLKGKFIRPKMCLLGSMSNITNGSFSNSYVSDFSLTHLCTAIELYHLSALIHDDIIDNTDTRRSNPATHIYFSNFHKKNFINTSAEKYGINAAILLGDLLLSKSFEHIQKINISNLDTYRNVIQYFTEITKEVAIGQYYDLYASNQQADEKYLLDKDIIKNILISKTAHYTVTKPFILGNKISGNSNTNIEKITQALVSWGIAFQMKDDELGIFGNRTKTGKPAGIDLIEEKKTLLLAFTLENLSIADRKEVIKVLPTLKEKNPIEQAELIENIKKQIVNSGAYYIHETKMKDYYNKGYSILKDLNINEEVKKYLLDFGQSLIEREG